MSATPNRASSAGKPRKKDVTLDLPTARRMLPLIKVIVAEIVGTRQRIDTLIPERDTLDEYRRSLTWASRQRRYALQEEITAAEKTLATAAAELDALGVALTDLATGEIDFPTRINGRPAAFSWRHGEDGVAYWHYAGEDTRRPIPADWQPGTPLRLRAEP
jgi:hypothetical protein